MGKVRSSEEVRRLGRQLRVMIDELMSVKTAILFSNLRLAGSLTPARPVLSPQEWHSMMVRHGMSISYHIILGDPCCVVCYTVQTGFLSCSSPCGSAKSRSKNAGSCGHNSDAALPQLSWPSSAVRTYWMTWWAA